MWAVITIRHEHYDRRRRTYNTIDWRETEEEARKWAEMFKTDVISIQIVEIHAQGGNKIYIDK